MKVYVYMWNEDVHGNVIDEDDFITEIQNPFFQEESTNKFICSKLNELKIIQDIENDESIYQYYYFREEEYVNPEDFFEINSK